VLCIFQRYSGSRETKASLISAQICMRSSGNKRAAAIFYILARRAAKVELKAEPSIIKSASNPLQSAVSSCARDMLAQHNDPDLRSIQGNGCQGPTCSIPLRNGNVQLRGTRSTK